MSCGGRIRDDGAPPMNNDASTETKRALLRAALNAQAAGEEEIGASRIAAALLRTMSSADFCERMQIDSTRVCAAADDPDAPSFDECDRAVRDKSLEDLRLRPFAATVASVVDRVVGRHGHVAVPPLQLLYEIVRANLDVASRLSAEGLTAEVITADLGEERC